MNTRSSYFIESPSPCPPLIQSSTPRTGNDKTRFTRSKQSRDQHADRNVKPHEQKESLLTPLVNTTDDTADISNGSRQRASAGETFQASELDSQTRRVQSKLSLSDELSPGRNDEDAPISEYREIPKDASQAEYLSLLSPEQLEFDRHANRDFSPMSPLYLSNGKPERRPTTTFRESVREDTGETTTRAAAAKKTTPNHINFASTTFARSLPKRDISGDTQQLLPTTATLPLSTASLSFDYRDNLPTSDSIVIPAVSSDNDYSDDIGPEITDPKAAFEQLLDCIKDDQHQKLRVLLTRKSTINVINQLDDYDSYSPLIWAAKLGHVECVKLLCRHPEVSIDQNGGWNNSTALLMAVERNRVDTVAILLDARASVNYANKAKLTSLMLAAELQLSQILDMLLLNRAECKQVDNDKYTALILAAWHQNSYAVRKLCEYNPTREHLEIENKYGKTAFFLAVEKNDAVCAKILHQYHANPNALSKRRVSPLMIACVLGNQEVFDYLVEPASNPVADLGLCSVVDEVKHTAMTYACISAKCKRRIYEVLIDRYFENKAGQDPELVCTALSGICKVFNKHAVYVANRLLAGVKEHWPKLARYRDPETQNTFVMYACMNGNIDLLHVLLTFIKQASIGEDPDHDHYSFNITAKNKDGKTGLMLLAEYFTNNDEKMIEYLKTAASTYSDRYYLLDMFPHLLKKCKSPQTVMNKCKQDVVYALKSQTGIDADVQLVGALVNIAVALKVAAKTHGIEARELLQMSDEFEGALLEIMNCASMDDPANVTKVLRRQADESILFSDHVLKANSICSGPLSQCVEHELSRILSTAQIATFVQSVFYSSLKVKYPMPVRTIPDIFRLRSGAATSRFKPFVMFSLECLFMPIAMLLPVTFLAMATDQAHCIPSLERSVLPQLTYLCEYYDSIVLGLKVMLCGRILYEWGEFISGIKNKNSQNILEAIYRYAICGYEHIRNDIWNFLDVVTIVSLVVWVAKGYPSSGCLAWATITLCIGLLRFLSLRQQIGQLTIMIFAMSKDLLPFVSIFFTAIVGFGLGFRHMFADVDDFKTVRATVITLFDAALGTHDFSKFKDNNVGIMMMVVYIVVVTLVLLNLVVARMSATHEKIDVTALEVWCRTQAVNTKEFALLRDRHPMCMLPAPFNIISFGAYVVWDWMMPSFLKPKPIPLDDTDHGHHPYPVPNQQISHTATTPTKVLSIAGTISDKIVSLLASPVDAFYEIYYAFAEMHVYYRFQTQFFVIALFPVWLLLFWMLIVVATFAEEATYTKNDGTLRVLFGIHSALGYKPGLVQLCWLIIISAMIILGFLSYAPNGVCMWETSFHNILSQDALVHIVLIVYNLFVLQLCMLALLFICCSRLAESWRLIYVGLALPELKEKWRQLNEKIRRNLFLAILLNTAAAMGLYYYVNGDSMMLLLAECTELLVTVLIISFLCRAKKTVSAEIVPPHYANRKGTPKVKETAGEFGTLYIDIIRGEFPITGTTVFGTSRNPFVMISYDNSSTHEVEADDILYTKTIESNATQASFYDKFSFDLRQADFFIHFEVFDRQGDDIIKYLCGARCDMREWIANRRFEAQIPLRDAMDRPLPDNIQVSCLVKYPPRVSKTPHRGFIPGSGSNGNTPRRTDSTPTRQSYRQRSMTDLFASSTRSSFLKGSALTPSGTPCSAEREAVLESNKKSLFSAEDRDKIFDKLANKSERSILLQVLQQQTELKNAVEELCRIATYTK